MSADTVQSSASKSDCCVRCGAPAEVAHPDGNGEQVGFCGLHEPTESGETGE